MDKGEWLKRGFYVRPVLDGSLIIHEHPIESGMLGHARGFSCVSDFVDFVADERLALIKSNERGTPETEQ